MQVQKFRAKANGLVPAGAYFEQLARKLEENNARETARRASLEAEDLLLKARYRRASAARRDVNSFATAM